MIALVDSRALFGMLLLATQAALAVPLVYRLWRSDKRQGISIVGEMIWVSGGAGWAVYAVMVSSVTLVVSGVLAVITSGLLSALLWRHTDARQRTAALWGSVSVAFMLAASARVAGVAGISLTLALFGIVQFIPQAVQSLQQLVRGEESHGVSVIGVALRGAYTLGWAVWAGATFLWPETERVDWPLVAWGVAGGIAFTLQALAATKASARRRLVLS